MERLLRHQRGLVEAGEDQLELARIGIDVADGEDAGDAGLERAGVGRDQLVLHLQPPFGDRAELHGEAEERKHGIELDARFRSVVSLHRHGGERAVGAFERGHLADLEIHVAGRDQRAHLVHAVGRAAEVVAPVHQRETLRNRLQIERPVERRVAAADDQQALVAELLHLAHGIEDGFFLVGLDARNRRALGLERAAAGRDHDAFCLERLAGIGAHAEEGIADLLERGHHLPEMEGGVKRLDLVHQLVGDALAGDDRDAGNVVDRLFRIELGALTADLVENVDEVRLDVEQAELEHREQADRTRADDQHIGLDRLVHALHPGRGRLLTL